MRSTYETDRLIVTRTMLLYERQSPWYIRYHQRMDAFLFGLLAVAVFASAMVDVL